MLKNDIKAYKIVVDHNESRATLICVTYKIGFTGNHYGAEFFELVTSFSNEEIHIPAGGHTFSFKEALRLFATAAEVAPDGRKNIEYWVTGKMQEAYGQNSKVHIELYTK
jgi:hypothetical protein